MNDYEDGLVGSGGIFIFHKMLDGGRHWRCRCGWTTRSCYPTDCPACGYPMTEPISIDQHIQAHAGRSLCRIFQYDQDENVREDDSYLQGVI